jgi:glycine/D-amino acid oxidase-like deaminating enzyme
MPNRDTRNRRAGRTHWCACCWSSAALRRPVAPAGRGYPGSYSGVNPYNHKDTAGDDVVTDVYARCLSRVPAFEARLMHAHVTPDWLPFVGLRTGIAGHCDACGGTGHAFKTGPIFAFELLD